MKVIQIQDVLDQPHPIAWPSWLQDQYRVKAFEIDVRHRVILTWDSRRGGDGSWLVLEPGGLRSYTTEGLYRWFEPAPEEIP